MFDRCDGFESCDFGGEVLLFSADTLELLRGGVVRHVQADQLFVDGVELGLVDEELSLSVLFGLEGGSMPCICGVVQCFVVGVALSVF